MDFVRCFINVSDLLKKFYTNERVTVIVDTCGLYRMVTGDTNNSAELSYDIGYASDFFDVWRRDYNRKLYNIDNYLKWLSARHNYVEATGYPNVIPTGIEIYWVYEGQAWNHGDVFNIDDLTGRKY